MTTEEKAHIVAVFSAKKMIEAITEDEVGTAVLKIPFTAENYVVHCMAYTKAPGDTPRRAATLFSGTPDGSQDFRPIALMREELNGDIAIIVDPKWAQNLGEEAATVGLTLASLMDEIPAAAEQNEGSENPTA